MTLFHQMSGTNYIWLFHFPLSQNLKVGNPDLEINCDFRLVLMSFFLNSVSCLNFFPC